MRSLLYITITILIASCTGINNNNCRNSICTTEFRMITVKVTDSLQSNVTLDDYYTIQLQRNDTIRLNSTIEEGTYVILDDNHSEEVKNIQSSYRFVGVKGGVAIVSEEYQIGADCCHIYLAAGNTNIQVQ